MTLSFVHFITLTTIIISGHRRYSPNCRPELGNVHWSSVRSALCMQILQSLRMLLYRFLSACERFSQTSHLAETYL